MSVGNTKYGDGSLQNNINGSNNSAFGICSSRDTDVSWNTSVGAYANMSNVSGISNVAIGTNALLLNDGGSYNAALGTAALLNNKSNSNTAVGSNAMEKNTDGKENIAVGVQSGYENTIGEKNVFIGSYAGFENIDGSENVFLGYNSGNGVEHGTNNTFLGSRTTTYLNNSYNNSTAIGYGSVINSDNQIMMGTGNENIIIPGNAYLTNLNPNYTENSIVSKKYVDNFVSGGITIVSPCDCATNEDISLSGLYVPSSIDGVPLNNGMRVLVRCQDSSNNVSSSEVDNGIYDYNLNSFTRAPDCSGNNVKGQFTFIKNGSLNGSAIFVQNENSIAGTGPLKYIEFQKLSFTIGDGLEVIDGILQVKSNLTDTSGEPYLTNIGIIGTLDVSENVTMNDKLRVTGDTSFNSNVDVSGNLVVFGDTSLNDKLNVAGNANFNSNMDVSGMITQKIDVNLNSNLFKRTAFYMYGNNNDGTNTSAVEMIDDVTNYNLSGIQQGRGFYFFPNAAGNAINTIIQKNDSVITSRLPSNNNTLTLSNYGGPKNGIRISSSSSTIGNVTIQSGNNSIITNSTSNISITGDTSFNSNVDVSRNLTSNNLNVRSNHFVGGDVSMNGKLFVGGDVSMNSKLFVGGSSNFNSNVDVSGILSSNDIIVRRGYTLSLNTDTRIYQYATQYTNTLGKTIFAGDVSMNDKLSVGGDVSMNSKLFVGGDVSMNGKLSVVGDVSMNSKLFVGGDVSMNGKLSVGGDASFNSNVNILGNLRTNELIINKLTAIGDVSLNQKLFVGGDVSLNQKLFVGGDVSMNSKLFVGGDVSMNSKLFVGGDVSMNSKLFVGGDVSMNSKLFVRGDVSMNGKVSVGGDISLNQKLSVGGDVSLNQKIFVGGGSNFNSNVDVSGTLTMRANNNITFASGTGSIQQQIVSGDLLTQNSLKRTKISIISGFPDGSGTSALDILDESGDSRGLFVLPNSSDGNLGDTSVKGDCVIGSRIQNGGSITISNWNSNLKNGLRVFTTDISNCGLTLQCGQSSSTDWTELRMAYTRTGGANTTTTTFNNVINFNPTTPSVIGASRRQLIGLGTLSFTDISGNSTNGSRVSRIWTDSSLETGLGTGMFYDCSMGGLSGHTFRVSDGTGNKINALAVSPGQIRMISNVDVSGNLSVGGDVSLNQKLFVVGDVSMNGNLSVGGDVSLNQKLFVVGDVSMNGKLSVGGDVSLNSKLSVGSDVSMNGKLFVGEDVSLNQKLFVGGDVSMNGKLFVGEDVSLNQKLFVGGDVSLNQKLFVDGDVSINGNLTCNDKAYVTNVDETNNSSIVNVNYINQRIDNLNQIDAYPSLNPYSSGVKAVSTWSMRPAPISQQWMSVCWSPELSLFAAVSYSGTNSRVMTSHDGINWTSRTTPDMNCTFICWSRKKGFVVVGINNTKVMTSSNGVTWTSRTGIDESWNCVCWSDELNIFVAVSSSKYVMTSPDGETWESHETIFDGAWTSICWSAEKGIFVAVSGSAIITSNDGKNWVLSSSSVGSSNICWSSKLGLFVGISAGISTIVSSDGITWNTYPINIIDTWHSICWSAELELFVSFSNVVGINRVMTSPDGINWTRRIAPNTDSVSFQQVCWSPELGIFVAVANNYGTTKTNLIMISSLRGRPPTSYNVFDSSFNSIDQNGNWNLKVTKIENTTNSDLAINSIITVNNNIVQTGTNASTNRITQSTIVGDINDTNKNSFKGSIFTYNNSGNATTTPCIICRETHSKNSINFVPKSTGINPIVSTGDCGIFSSNESYATSISLTASNATTKVGVRVASISQYQTTVELSAGTNQILIDNSLGITCSSNANIFTTTGTTNEQKYNSLNHTFRRQDGNDGCNVNIRGNLYLPVSGTTITFPDNSVQTQAWNSTNAGYTRSGSNFTISNGASLVLTGTGGIKFPDTSVQTTAWNSVNAGYTISNSNFTISNNANLVLTNTGGITLGTGGIKFSDNSVQYIAYSSTKNDKLQAIGNIVRAQTLPDVFLTTNTIHMFDFINLIPGTWIITGNVCVSVVSGPTTIGQMLCGYSSNLNTLSQNRNLGIFNGNSATYTTNQQWTLFSYGVVTIESLTTYRLLVECSFGTSGSLKVAGLNSDFFAVRIA